MDIPILLLVEDDVLLASLFKTVLADAGFDVRLARDATEALDVIEDDGPRLAALVTDIRLGSGPKGWTVATRAREAFPALPVVYMTGDSAADWSAHGVPNSVLVQKPFVAAQLVTAVTTLMNETSSSPLAPEER